ncbi:long-chain acyl-CoA synthetase [Hephaestia caeni]|uniref:3-methylmercaptopropionyl-CoA ligase n=1 Tax=Hephaestia caeni TaxID=645617 RepID=A0A397NX37_9SPHN|nr:long-chain fatty acid--CoA ligase [Hephaestia caeni]RIA37961.1 long-chain acyl-CoA synthetase [Hephaestia caeni]
MRVRLTYCLERAARLFGDRIATVEGAKRRPWSVFRDEVMRLAGGLRQLGVAADERVAVLANNSAAYLDLYYATMWAEAVIVPLNTRLAAAEIEFQLDDAGVRVLFYGPEFAPVVAKLRTSMTTPPHFVAIDTALAGDGTLAEVRASGTPIPEPMRGGDDLAGIFFTGGTTGRPKGVMLSHESLHAMSRNFVMGFSVDEHCVNLHSAPMFHVSAVGIFFTTMVGGIHVFTSTFEPGALIDLLERERVTHCFTVPAIIDRVTKHPKAATADLSAMRIFGYGGSAMPVALMLATRERFPTVGLAHGYGMTEVPALTLLGPDDHKPGADTGRLRSVGRVMCEYEIKVVADDGRECAPGETGEIIARGPNMMLGYWHRPAETAEALRDGWMHTQDIGYFDEAGYLFISDRIKDMIVSGAENVYSIEVEDVLYRHPAVEECAIIGVPDEKWGERVHAIVVAKSGQTIDPTALIGFCREYIAGYKCPKTVEVREEPLPRSAAGKVLKVELRHSAQGGAAVVTG